MSSTNKTTYYELPQFVDDDIFNPLVDDNDAYNKIDTALHQIAEAEADDASEIVGVKNRVTTAEGKIEALETQNGVEVLTTTAQTLSGAVNELDGDVASLDGRLDVVEGDINNVNTGLKAKVSALETQNGNSELTTTAQTLSGAVNELDAEIGDGELLTPLNDNLVDAINNNFLNSVFASQRYGSKQATDTVKLGGQAVQYYNGKFYGTGENYADNNFYVTITDATTLEIVNSYTYNYDCHPNSMFRVDDYLYIIDGKNRRIFKISISDMQISNIFTMAEIPQIVSGCVWGDYIYLMQAWTVFKCNKNFEVISSVSLVARRPQGIVRQNLFVYDDHFYVICNRPNVLVIYDMDGTYIATKEMGDGSGYYPYGEIESFFIMNDDICFNGAIWDGARTSLTNGIWQIFISNINKPIISDAYMGQSLTGAETIYAEKDFVRASINPRGLSTDDQFDNPYEASAVFNYLYHKYNCVQNIVVTGDFSDNFMTFANCRVSISHSDNLGYVRLFNCHASFNHNVVINRILAEYSTIICDRCEFGNMLLSASEIWLGGCKITGDIDLRSTTILDSLCNCVTTIDKITLSAGNCSHLTHLYKYADLAQNDATTNPLLEAFLYDRFKGIAFEFFGEISFGNTIEAYPIDAYFVPASNTSISEGGTSTKSFNIFTVLNSTPVIDRKSVV